MTFDHLTRAWRGTILRRRWGRGREAFGELVEIVIGPHGQARGEVLPMSAHGGDRYRVGPFMFPATRPRPETVDLLHLAQSGWAPIFRSRIATRPPKGRGR